MLAIKEFDQFNNPQHFEVHVTIFPTDDIEPFIKICNSFVEHSSKFKSYKGVYFKNANVVSCKPIIIVLPDGKYKQQPMCSTYIYGNLIQAVKYGEIFSDYVVECHPEYKVSRNKVEARLRNVDNSINLDPTKEEFEGKYWEFHAKLSFDTKSIQNKYEMNKNKDIVNLDIKSLNANYFEKHVQVFREELMKNFPNCRLSKSALSNYDKSHTDNCTRIVTLRIYSGTKLNALNNLNLLIEFLKSVSVKYDFEMRGDIEKELSVYDSNVKHDLGWISMIDVNNSSSYSDNNKSAFDIKKVVRKKEFPNRITLFLGLLIFLIMLYLINSKM